MLTIPGYTISEILDDQRTVLLRATRGGRRVLLRTLPKGPLSSEEQSRVRYGCKLSEELDLPGVLKALGIERHGDTLVVVLEDFDGQPLRLLLAGGPLDLLAALHIAAAPPGCSGTSTSEASSTGTSRPRISWSAPISGR
jgi:hypothetical protein